MNIVNKLHERNFLFVIFTLIFGNSVYGLSVSEFDLKYEECKEGLIFITKYNENVACVKPTSVYPLLQRGWASHEKTDTAAMSIDIAQWFVKSSPTFAFDGIENSLEVKIVAVRESYPEQYEIEATFTSSAAGYGDRSDKFLAQVITPHTLKMVVSSGNVISAIMDDEWDELNQKLWKVHDLPDVDDSVTQNSDVLLGGNFSVQTSLVNYDGTSGFIARPSESGNYPGVDHAFANPTGTRYAPIESADAWEKTLNFFETNLK